MPSTQPGQPAVRSRRGRGLRRPQTDVTAAQGHREQFGELVRGTGEGGHAQRGQRGGLVVVVRRRAGVGQGEQHDHPHSVAEQLRDPAFQLALDASLEQVGDQHQDGVGWSGDDALAVRQGPVDVGAAAELAAEQHVDRVGQPLGEVDHLGVERHQPGPHRWERSQGGSEDRGIDHRLGHRTRLVDSHDHVLGHRRRPVPVADEPFGDERAPVGKVVVKVASDRGVPVDVPQPGATGPVRPAHRAAHRRPGRVGDPPLDLGHHLADHHPGRTPRRLGHHLVEADQGGGQMHVGLHRVQQLGLEQHAGQVRAGRWRRAASPGPRSSGSSCGCLPASAPPAAPRSRAPRSAGSPGCPRAHPRRRRARQARRPSALRAA